VGVEGIWAKQAVERERNENQRMIRRMDVKGINNASKDGGFQFIQFILFIRGDQGERKAEAFFFYPPSCGKNRIFLTRRLREEDV